MYINNQKIFFLVLITMSFLALQVPLVHLVGSKAQFTLFDSIAPVVGVFTGTILGIVAIILVQFANVLIHGSHIIDVGIMIRFIPILFAMVYFAKRNHLNWIIPLLAIISFNLNPIGRSVWFYSLYWIIPIICYFWEDKYLFARSLGATFTAHAVGGAVWIWVFKLPASVWIGLIPVVAVERLTFAIGISAAYLAIKELERIIVKNEVYQS